MQADRIIARGGFTLIELSIVLVIIGLIVGGVLVGQDLIRAAGVRATISQIEKYNTAANTFRKKYNYLPGDIKDPDASNFGFIARGSIPGEGDGNGILQGMETGTSGGYLPVDGETAIFWVDLSTAHLIDSTFIDTTSLTGNEGTVDTTLPPAKLGGGNYIYVWSGGTSVSYANSTGDGRNYFGLSAASGILNTVFLTETSPGLTVQQALAIDTKTDDGLPQSGNVFAGYLNQNIAVRTLVWAAGGTSTGASSGSNGPTTTATAGSSTTCYDNSATANGTPGVGGAVQHYSVEISNGSNVNCALTFRMQAGD